MRRGETSVDVFTISQAIENPRAVQLTYRQGNYIIIQKQYDDLDYEILYDDFGEPYATQITCRLSQEETFEFWANDDALVQLRIIDEFGDSDVSDIIKIKIEECLDCNILPLDDNKNG